jgi:hypothetical protein
MSRLLTIQQINASRPPTSWLVAIQRDPKDNERVVCVCRPPAPRGACGKRISVEVHTIRNGHASSCGCRRRRTVNEMNALLDASYQLRILRRDGLKHVVCMCLAGGPKCRRTFRTQTAGVLAGHTKSCGCIHPANPPLGLSVAAYRNLQIYMDGLLLGDGHLTKSTSTTFTLAQATAGHGWQIKIRRDLKQFGLRTTIGPVVTRGGIIEGRRISPRPRRHLHSEVRPELKAMRQRWYPRGIKAVPRDVRLTPVCLANWIAGDGCGTEGGLVLHTQSFTKRECHRLATALPVPAVVQRARKPGQYTIRVPRRYVARIDKLVRAHMPACKRYKLDRALPDLPNPNRTPRMQAKQKADPNAESEDET